MTSIRISWIAKVGPDNAAWLAAQREIPMGLEGLGRILRLDRDIIGLTDDQYEALVERGEDENADGGIFDRGTGLRIWVKGDRFRLEPAPDDDVMLDRFGVRYESDDEGEYMVLEVILGVR